MKQWSLDARSGERNRLIPLFKGWGKRGSFDGRSREQSACFPLREDRFIPLFKRDV